MYRKFVALKGQSTATEEIDTKLLSFVFPPAGLALVERSLERRGCWIKQAPRIVNAQAPWASCGNLGVSMQYDWF
jgi:hypothetical protein